MGSPNDREEDEFVVTVGTRIKSYGDYGTVRYIGEVFGHKGSWYGIEWDDPARGKHDGSVEGIQYFKTRTPGAGSFVRPNKIDSFTTCADAIRKYYGEPEDEILAAHRKKAINEWKKEMGVAFIEMVGFEKIKQKQKFDCLREACVQDQNINKAGNVSAVCPNLRSLDVSRNLFSTWREVITLSAQLPELEDLSVSKNRMAIDIADEDLSLQSIFFSNLKKLTICSCEYDWQDILRLSRLWPRINEVIAAFNQITKISIPKNTFRTLTILRLDGNLLSSWQDVMNLGMLNLKVLSLNECELEQIRFNDVPWRKVDLFESLDTLFLNRNKIADWRSISELNKLKCLKKLYFLKNPLQKDYEYDTAAQLIIARIGTLKELNGSEIFKEIRRGSDYDYMYRHGAEWKLAQSDPLMKLKFDTEHCRFHELVDKYGIPEDSLLVPKGPKNSTLTSQLLEVTLQDESGKELKKKFPPNMTVQKLMTLAQRMFSKGKTGYPLLYKVDHEMKNAEIQLDSALKDLDYYSIRNGDTVLVRFK